MPGSPTFVQQRRLALFEEQRPRLMGIAYRVLGAVSDADDVLREVGLRWSRVSLAEVEDAEALLTRMVTRLSLDRLRRERALREVHAGSWLPEPVACQPWTADGATTTELVESLSLPMLAAMEALSPLERAAFVLRVVFEDSYAQVATALDRNEAAVRQLVHRAHVHLGEAMGGRDADRTRHDDVMRRFVTAWRAARLTPLLEVLAADVVVVSDGGGLTREAQPVVGRDRAARFLVSVLRRLPRGAVVAAEEFNGTTGVVVRVVDEPVIAVAVLADGDRVGSVQLVATPRKLLALRAPSARTALI
ncbi:MAG: sigma factor-like helix-turn-helix DNA-binding protein [Lapillicoccus sp.]